MIEGYPYIGYKEECSEVPITFPPQHQHIQPGLEVLMCPKPIFDNPDYTGSDKLKNKIALITGGDSGIGRAVSLVYAKEGADIAIVYFNEHVDANKTKALINGLGRKCLLISGDLRSEDFCKNAVQTTVSYYGHLDILVNNAGVAYPQNRLEDITSLQLEDTFKTNIFPLFHVTKAALRYMKKGGVIINTASLAAYVGYKELIDYSSSKGAVVTFTKSLALSLIERGIRVSGVAPGWVWTPLIVSAFTSEFVTTFGTDAPMKRASQPVEIAPAYVYLASEDSTYVTGQILHVNGGYFMG